MCGLGTIERVVQKMKNKGSGCDWRAEGGSGGEKMDGE